MDCIFCEIAKGNVIANMIYQDNLISCFLDSDPINEGHVLIIPNQHYSDIDEVSEEVLLDIISLARRIVTALKEKYAPNGYSIMQNGGDFCDFGHYHMHVFPRYKNDAFAWSFSDDSANYSMAIANEIKDLLQTNS